MSPQTIKKLQENIPELRELIAFLTAEAEELNVIADIHLTSPTEIALEVLARQRAYKTIKDILSPLLDTQETIISIDPSEYVV